MVVMQTRPGHQSRMLVLFKLLMIILCADVGVVIMPPHTTSHALCPGNRGPYGQHKSVTSWLFRLRGGSPGQSTSRAKSKFLAYKVERQVSTHQDRKHQKMRNKLVAIAKTGGSNANTAPTAEEGMGGELDALDAQSSDPPSDAVARDAAQAQADAFDAKYPPGEIVEISDSEEWRRVTAVDAKTHSVSVFEDQTELIRKHNERFAAGIEANMQEQSDDWDLAPPDGMPRGEEKVPRLEWGQDPAEIAGLLGDFAEQRGLEQWIGERQLHYLQEAEADALAKAAIDVEARARELYIELVRDAAGEEGSGGGDLPQPRVAFQLCLQVVTAWCGYAIESVVLCLLWMPHTASQPDVGVAGL